MWPHAARRPVFTLILAGLMALFVWGASEWSYQHAVAALDSLDHRAQARQAMQTVLRRMQAAESAQRGYLLTARPAYLVPLDAVRSDVDQAIALLHRHYRADARADALTQRLQDRCAERLSELQLTLALHDSGEHQRWRDLMLSDIGREKMDESRAAVEHLLVIEDESVQSERTNIYRTLALSRLGVHLSTLLALVGLAFFIRQTAVLNATERAHAQALRAERDNLEGQVRERTLELRGINRHLQDVREAERGQLARSLHDYLGALLTAAKLDMARLRHAMFNGARSTDLNLRLAHLADTIDRVIVFKRAMIEELSPSALHHLGLHTALDIVVTALRQRTGIEVALDATDIELEPAVRTVAFRVVEACLDNIERHAAVKVAQVRVLVEGEQLQIQVCDAGAGFVPGDGPDAKHGLANLRHRLESIGGQLRITSAPGQGTQVQASLPLHLDPGRAPGGVHQASDQPDGPGPGMPAA